MSFKGIIITFIVFLFFCILLVNSMTVLFTFAKGADVPSRVYYYSTERLYRISESRDVGKYCRERLNNKEFGSDPDEYIHTLGIIGDQHSSSALMKKYVEYQNDPNYRHTVSVIIESIGLIGDEDYLPILKTILDHYEYHDMRTGRYIIARAIYLISGENYEHTNQLGEKMELTITQELLDARNVIVQSKGRKRTFEEMIILDNLFRSPDWIKEL